MMMMMIMSWCVSKYKKTFIFICRQNWATKSPSDNHSILIQYMVLEGLIRMFDCDVSPQGILAFYLTWTVVADEKRGSSTLPLDVSPQISVMLVSFSTALANTLTAAK